MRRHRTSSERIARTERDETRVETWRKQRKKGKIRKSKRGEKENPKTKKSPLLLQ
jgi:hypothetical protein